MPKEWRMSGVEWAILFLQLMVAIIQLLDAYLKFGA
ncbi:type I toxin-antitoxin system toxin TisB [Enterobacter bugandensis]|nr:type I toxin-antitoxin system toxin TisB [Enterobacter bugandensis]PLA87075.1 type I toxin-antitoxin system toxin TisB [Enterobacter bugandensis]